MWVVDIERILDDEADDLLATMPEEWRNHCIFRVPPHFKMVYDNAFKPQAVTLGPFHHDRDSHAVMEGHKRRAVRHLLRRAGETLRDLAVAEELEDAYTRLGAEWRGPNRGRFLEVMIADGCFLLEVMRNYAIETSRKDSNDYTPSDPVFSPHAVVHIAAFLHRDMLMIENQLPLHLLQKIVAVEGEPSDDAWINKLVLDFLAVDVDNVAHVGAGLGLHPLELYRRSLLRKEKPSVLNRGDQSMCSCFGPRRSAANKREDKAVDDQADRRRAPRSAQKLLEVGIRFRPSTTRFLDDVSFRGRRREVRIPLVVLDDSTEYAYQNVMAFEALHAGTGNDVTAFVRFMRDHVFKSFGLS